MTPLEGWDPLVDNASAHIGADAFERFRILPSQRATRTGCVFEARTSPHPSG